MVRGLSVANGFLELNDFHAMSWEMGGRVRQLTEFGSYSPRIAFCDPTLPARVVGVSS